MTYDIAIVGAGVLGLAHAYHLGKAGKRVLVIERGPKAQGASVRNFGMLWPIGQPPGEAYKTAVRSREIWLDVLKDARLWHAECGSLHLAYHGDEACVLQELAESGLYPARFVTPAEVVGLAKGIRPANLAGALWSETEVNIDPREAVAGLPGYLTERLGVEFRFGTTALGFERGCLWTSGGVVETKQLLVCGGDDIQTLYPEAFAAEDVVRCKLQMLRTEPQHGEWRVGPMLAAGLTLAHYKAFEICPSLPALKERLTREFPEYLRYGIHVLVSQNGAGELTLGDSHEYGDAIEPFDKERIDGLILQYLATFLEVPRPQLSQRWHGTYLKHKTRPWLIARPDDGVTLVTGVGGAGMTLAFGLAEKVVSDDL